MKRAGILLSGIIVVVCLHAQSPFQWNKTQDIAFTTLPLLFSAGAYISNQSFEPLSHSEIISLTKTSVNSFDRSATHFYSPQLAEISDYLLYASILGNVPLMLATRKYKEHKWEEPGKLLVMCIETQLLTYAGTEWTKLLVHRIRPYVYNENVIEEIKREPDARKSFFSGHTSFVAANSFFMASVLSAYYPDSRFKKGFKAAALALPAITGWLRYRSGKHFPSDVVAGYAYGAFCGWLVPYLHQNTNQKVSILCYPGYFSCSILLDNSMKYRHGSFLFSGTSSYWKALPLK